MRGAHRRVVPSLDQCAAVKLDGSNEQVPSGLIGERISMSQIVYTFSLAIRNDSWSIW